MEILVPEEFFFFSFHILQLIFTEWDLKCHCPYQLFTKLYNFLISQPSVKMKCSSCSTDEDVSSHPLHTVSTLSPLVCYVLLFYRSKGLISTILTLKALYSQNICTLMIY